MSNITLSALDLQLYQALDKDARRFPDYPHGLFVSQRPADHGYVPPNLGPALQGITIPLMTLAIFIVGLRLYANKSTPGVGLGKEDYAIIPATVRIRRYSLC
jgi:hypothetical protein